LASDNNIFTTTFYKYIWVKINAFINFLLTLFHLQGRLNMLSATAKEVPTGMKTE